MGIGPGSRCKSSPYAVPDSNPNPELWSLVKQESWVTMSGQQVLIVEVNYPNCTNYEGNKLMVFIGFRNIDEVTTRTGGKLDPHFQETRFAPVARFRPGSIGWRMARDFAKVVP